MDNKEEIVIIKGKEWRMTMIDAPDYTGQPDKIDYSGKIRQMQEGDTKELVQKSKIIDV
jgi:hypothetical protein